MHWIDKNRLDHRYEADVTSAYFALIGYSRGDLGRPVLDTFRWHELK